MAIAAVLATPGPAALRPAAAATVSQVGQHGGAAAAAKSPKKGVSTWAFPGLAGAVADVGASWYYNWSPSNKTMPANAAFVPMIWGAASVTDANLAVAKAQSRVLLAFNEPDLPDQSNKTVEQALALWPRLQATGMRLGSPAVAFGADTPGGWLDRFISGVRARGYRLDFITLHWYGSDFSAAATNHFSSYVKAVHDRYRLPIWVTEYGLINFSGTPKYPNTQQITSFIKASTSVLEGLPYVERYAWFSLPAVGESLPYGLYRDGSTPTAAGEAYRAVGR